MTFDTGGGFTLHFGDTDDDWENVTLDKLTLDTNSAATDGSTVQQPEIPDNLDSDVPGEKIMLKRPQQQQQPQQSTNIHLAETQEEIDPYLQDALEVSAKRMMLLKYEDDILKFVNDSTKQCLSLPPLNSYQRLLIHRLSDRFGLDRENIDRGYGGYNAGINNGEYDQPIRSITLFKTERTTIPPLLINMKSPQNRASSGGLSPSNSSDSMEQAAPKVMVKKMLKRNPKGNQATKTKMLLKKDASNGSMTISEREAKYAAARARIFGDEDEEESSNNNGSTSPLPPSSNTSQMAKGPENGSTGFGDSRTGGSGRGSVSRSASEPSISKQSSGPMCASSPLVPDSSRSTSDGSKSVSTPKPSHKAHPSSPEDSDETAKSRGSPPPRPNSTGSAGKAINNGKTRGPKQVRQNRTVDLHDPDFIRQDAYVQGKGLYGMNHQSMPYPPAGYPMMHHPPPGTMPPPNTGYYGHGMVGGPPPNALYPNHFTPPPPPQQQNPHMMLRPSQVPPPGMYAMPTNKSTPVPPTTAPPPGTGSINHPNYNSNYYGGGGKGKGMGPDSYQSNMYPGQYYQTGPQHHQQQYHQRQEYDRGSGRSHVNISSKEDFPALG